MIAIGVLALQGAFLDHITCLNKIEGVMGREIRTEDELTATDVAGLIIPGGESTVMALMAERSGLIEPLQVFLGGSKPVWGTCAGMIFLAKSTLSTKIGGQYVMGRMNITVDRNHFGRQLNSFETQLAIPALAGGPMNAVFIRAPCVVEAGEGTEILATLDPSLDPKRDEGRPCHVAVRQEHMLVTAFHPELTDDLRMHRYFIDMVHESLAAVATTS